METLICSASYDLNAVCMSRNDTWLGQWKKQFQSFEIPFLRSGVNAHPCPVDVDTMRHVLDRTGDLRPLDGVSRTSIYHGPYHTTNLDSFNAFCEGVVERYHLSQARWIKATVESITPLQAHELRAYCAGCRHFDEHESPSNIFRVVLHDKRVIFAGRVVVANGPLNVPRWPEFRDHRTRLIAGSSCWKICPLM
jgi:hypothetical protein